MWNLPRIVAFKASTFLESSHEGNHRIQELADIPHISEDWGREDCVSFVTETQQTISSNRVCYKE